MDQGNAQDKRNVMDEFKGMSLLQIRSQLDARGSDLVIALENTERDFNAGSIVRSANAFGVRDVYIIGRRQWNKRGAMATDKYLRLHYMSSPGEFLEEMERQQRTVVAVDNIAESQPLGSIDLPKHCVLVFGQEGPGVSSELASAAKVVVAIEQFGSTRSINVGAAAAIVMYEWLRQHRLAN